MGLHKGHTNNPNGRPAGTPNKVTSATKDWILAIIEENKERIRADLESMDSETRVRAVFSLLNFVTPKQQSISIEEQAKIEEDALFAFLENAPEEAINAIAERVLELQRRNSNTDNGTINSITT